jgi:hypothetical protein
MRPMFIGAGLMFVLLTYSVTNAQMKTMDEVREEVRNANELIKQNKEQKLAEQKLESEKRRVAEEELKNEERRASEEKALDEKIRRDRERREQAEEKERIKRLNEKKVAEFIENNDVPSSCTCNSDTTIVFKSQIITLLSPMHCFCGNLDCVVGDNYSSCVKRRK